MGEVLEITMGVENKMKQERDIIEVLKESLAQYDAGLRPQAIELAMDATLYAMANERERMGQIRSSWKALSQNRKEATYTLKGQDKTLRLEAAFKKAEELHYAAGEIVSISMEISSGADAARRVELRERLDQIAKW